MGKTLVFITGMIGIAALTAFLFVEPIEIYAWLADPDVLLALVLGNAALAALRLFSTGHAWLLGVGRRWFVFVVLAAIVAIPHAAFAWVALETRDSLLKVFVEPDPVVSATGTTTTSSTTTTNPPETTTTEEVGLITVPTAPGEYGSDAIDFDLVPLWRPFGEDRLNILLLGGDAGPGRQGLRTDTMIVASIDPVSGDAALIGLPRNFGGVTFKDGSVVPVRRLNHVYWWASSQPDRFAGPDPGASAIREVVENITGLAIDYYMLVDLTGFAALVDVFGGVQIVVPRAVDAPIYDPDSGGYEMVRIEAGEQVLDGGHALAYARARYGSSDYVRMGRQRCIIASMVADADPLTLLPRFSDLLAVVEDHLSTDMPVELLPELVRLAPRVEPGAARVIGFDSTWGVGRTADGHTIPDIDRIRRAVIQLIEDPAATDALGAATVASACG